MEQALKKFFSGYADFSELELDDIVARFKSRKVEKNAFLLWQGDICKDLVFVQEGCLRLYYLNNGVEVSVWFSFQHNSAIEIYSFISEKPTNYFLQALEDSEIQYLSKTELNQLCNTYPKMQVMMKNFWEDVIINLISRFTALQTTSAEERYLELMHHSTLIQRIPQKYLASFIGVTPTSLSRIRKKLLKRD